MILIADDDKRIRDMLAAALRAEGHDIVTASNGSEAYDRVRATGCKCMVLDINMPCLSGVELLALLESENLSVPIIVSTGSDNVRDTDLTRYANVVEVLRKPVELDVMLAAVGRHAVHRTRVVIHTRSSRITADIAVFGPHLIAAHIGEAVPFCEVANATVVDLRDGRTLSVQTLLVSRSAIEWITPLSSVE